MQVETVLEEAFATGNGLLDEAQQLANKKADQQLFTRLLMMHRERIREDDMQSLEQLLVLNPEYEAFLTERSRHILKFTDLLFQAFMDTACLDDTLLERLYIFRFFTAQSMLLDSGFFRDVGQHPMALLDDIGSWLIGWQPALGKAAEKSIQRINSFLELLGSADDAIAIERMVSTFIEATKKEAGRASLLEQRVCDSEKGVMETRRARRAVDTFINRITTGVRLPRHAILFMHGPLRDGLYMLLLKHDASSSEWKRAARTAEDLVFSLIPNTDSATRQRIYQVIPKLPAALENLVSGVCSPHDLEDWLGGLENLHMMVLRGMPLEDDEIGCEDVTPLSFLDELKDISTSISANLLEKAEAVEPGQWMIYTNDRGDDLRCKLALKLPETRQVLFVNAQGAKCLEKSIEAFAYDLSVKDFVLLEQAQLMSRCRKQVISEFIQFYQKAEVKKAEAEKEALEKEQARLKAQREAEELAEKNRLAHLQRMKMEKLEREKQERQQQIENEKRLESQQTSEFDEVYRKVCLLKIGSWFEFQTENGVQKYKLAVLIGSTKKLIFVNKTGVKVGTYSFDDFAHRLLEGKVVMLEEADAFEHSLARVIKTLRKD